MKYVIICKIELVGNKEKLVGNRDKKKDRNKLLKEELVVQIILYNITEKVIDSDNIMIFASPYSYLFIIRYHIIRNRHWYILK